jgi:hypothetical protein
VFPLYLLYYKNLREDVTPEPIDLEKPQSFENNFIHHMAIGESSIMNKLRLNMTAMSIEKLIDDILKVIYSIVGKKIHLTLMFIFLLKNLIKEMRNDNMEKIRFGFAEKCDAGNSNENLTYNMSYLASVVHPLIIIRLLEHRLFTPLLKKTPAARNATHPSVSLSMAGGPGSYQVNPHGTNLQINPGYQHSVSISIGGHSQGGLHSASSNKITPSTSFPSNSHLLTIESSNNNNSAISTKSNSPMGRASMQLGRSNEGADDPHYQRKHSQISLFHHNRYEKSYTDSVDNDNFIITRPVTGQSSSGKSPMHASSQNANTTSKKHLFKDLSKRLLKTVNNSSNSTGNSGFKLKINPKGNKKSSNVSSQSQLNENENFCKFHTAFFYKNIIKSLVFVSY